MLSLEKAQRISLTTQVELRLKGALIVGAMKPGARLVTKDIAEQLGTSITPVREALLRLVSARALDASPAQAFQVPKMPLPCFQEITAIRKNLEGMAIRETCRRVNSTQIDVLHHLVESYHTATRIGVVESVLQANRALRFRLYDFSTLSTLTEMIEQLWVRIGPNFNFLYPATAKTVGNYADYGALLEALSARNEDEAEHIIHRVIDAGSELIFRQHYNAATN